MPASNYPYGFLNGLTVKGVPILNTYSGNVFWVDSVAGSDGNVGTQANPYATINGAIAGGVSDGRGDIILCKPNHAETITTAAQVALTKASCAIVGLGQGSARPTLTYTTNATANIPVTANNVTMQNFLLTTTYAGITSAFTTTGTAISTDFTLENISFTDSSTTLGFLAGYTTNSTANSWDGFTMSNCRFHGLGILTRTAVVSTVACNRLTLVDNFGVSLQTTVAMLMTAAATSNTNCVISRNKFSGAHTSSTLACGISGTGTAWSGVADNNYFFSLASGTGIWIPTTTKLALFNNYAPIAGAYATQGTLNPLAT